MKKINSAQGIKLALLGAALAASSAAFAADSGPSHRAHAHDRGHAFHHHHGQHKSHGFHHSGKGMHHERHFNRAGLVIPGYGVVSRDFVAGMGLNADQIKLVDEARQAAKDLRENRKERLKSMRESRMELFKSDTLTPEDALKRADEQRNQWQAERRKIDEKWLAVWNALDADQQTRIATHLKDKAEKAQQRAEKREERWNQRENARSERGTRAS